MQTDTSLNLLNTFSIYFAIGLGSFIVAMFGMIALFGWSMKDTLKHAKGMIVVGVFALLTPFLVSRLYLTTVVSTQAQVLAMEKVVQEKIDPTTVQLTVSFLQPVIAYVEYYNQQTGETMPILSNSALYKNNTHTFIINNITSLGGRVQVVVGGVKSQPINIQP